MSKNISQAKLDANRRNAQRSTGPKTPEGKKKSSANALTYGFTAGGVLLAADEGERYLAHVENFMFEHLPIGPTETFWVQTLADIAWTVSRIRALEQNYMTLNVDLAESPVLGPNLGEQALAQAQRLPEIAKQLELLSRYEQRKMRLFKQTLHDLEVFQNRHRGGVSTEEIEKLASMYAGRDMSAAPDPEEVPHTDAGRNPEVGFVFPDPETLPIQGETWNTSFPRTP